VVKALDLGSNLSGGASSNLAAHIIKKYFLRELIIF
jgi:hypothetical protein